MGPPRARSRNPIARFTLDHEKEQTRPEPAPERVTALDGQNRWVLFCALLRSLVGGVRELSPSPPTTTTKDCARACSQIGATSPTIRFKITSPFVALRLAQAEPVVVRREDWSQSARSDVPTLPFEAPSFAGGDRTATATCARVRRARTRPATTPSSHRVELSSVRCRRAPESS